MDSAADIVPGSVPCGTGRLLSSRATTLLLPTTILATATPLLPKAILLLDATLIDSLTSATDLAEFLSISWDEFKPISLGPEVGVGIVELEVPDHLAVWAEPIAIGNFSQPCAHWVHAGVACIADEDDILSVVMLADRAQVRVWFSKRLLFPCIFSSDSFRVILCPRNGVKFGDLVLVVDFVPHKGVA